MTGAEVIPEDEAGAANEADPVDEGGVEEIDLDEKLGVDDGFIVDDELASEDGVEDDRESDDEAIADDDTLPEIEDVADGNLDDDGESPEGNGCEVEIELRKVVALEPWEVLIPELLELELEELV